MVLFASHRFAEQQVHALAQFFRREAAGFRGHPRRQEPPGLLLHDSHVLGCQRGDLHRTAPERRLGDPHRGELGIARRLIQRKGQYVRLGVLQRATHPDFIEDRRVWRRYSIRAHGDTRPGARPRGRPAAGERARRKAPGVDPLQRRKARRKAMLLVKPS